MQESYFTWRQEIPPYFKHYSDATWHTLPGWAQSVYSRARHPSKEDWYKDVLAPVSITELRKCLAGCKNNKTGGPSGLSYEMIKALSDDTLVLHFLPLLNDILLTGNISPTLKGFNVWALEKEANTGSILELEGKLNIRPIALFESIIKILERILCYRLWKVLLAHNLIDKAQFGFIPKGRVDDALLAYLFILEDAHQYKHPFHMGVNDFSKAYDSVPHWAMRLTYRYYRMPPPLINLLLELDSGRFGYIITGHGRGRAIPLSCGLGQGSPLAPLKWTLFLNPLLEWVNTAPDPYIVSSPDGDIPISVMAFADDVTYFSSTNSGYRIRVSRGNAFAILFGLTLNYKKSFYTYANTPRHYTSADVYSQETKSYTPSTVIPPGQPIRILGGWMSVNMNWSKGKVMIHNNLLHYYDTLKNKDLTTSELRYIIRTVISSQALYYLNVTPLTDVELATLDNKMALLWKRSIGTIPGASTPLCFSPFGSAFPNLVEARRSLLIRQAHRILNSPGIVHKLAMSRLRGLSTEWGYPTCPLTMPFHTNVGFQHHWFARVHSALRAYNSTMPDTLKQVVLQPPTRVRDRALAPLLPHSTFAQLHATLAAKKLYWLGDVLDVTGTKLAHRNTLHLGLKDWQMLSAALAPAHKLLHTTDPLPQGPHMLPFEECPHKVGDLVMIPGQPPEDRLNTTFHTVVDILHEEGHLLLQLKQWSTIHQPQYIDMDNRTGRIRRLEGDIWAESHDTPLSTEFADACFTFPHTFVTVREDSYVERWKDWVVHHTKAALIWDTDSFTARKSFFRGQLTLDMVTDSLAIFNSRVQRKGDLYWNAEPTSSDPSHTCVECAGPDATVECTTHLTRMGSQGFAHATCFILTHQHICTHCQSLHASATPVCLTPPSHACSDGSYNPVTGSVSCGFSATGNPPQSWNFASSPHTPPSSYLAEIHGLALAYLATPPSTHHTHGFDNKALLPLHNSLWHSLRTNQLTLPWLVQMKYRAAIRHLFRCIQTRGQPLHLRHILSHMEHTYTDDEDLSILRDRLAEADAIATTAGGGYTQVPLATPLPHCSDDFPIMVEGSYSDDKVKSLLDRLGTTSHAKRLSQYKMEGYHQRSVSIPDWKLPSFPPGRERYRLRYWINRLPTFTELKRRGERRDDTCSRCFLSTENQLHSVVTCPANTIPLQRFRIKLLRTMRTHLTILPPQTRARDVQPLLRHRQITCRIVKGWSISTYDNHDRSKVLLQGDRLLKIEQLTHIPARVEHILSRTLTAEDTLNALYLPLPPYTVDFHLINLVCKEFDLPFHYNPLPFHPFIHSLQLDLEDLVSAHTGILIHILDPPNLLAKISPLIQTGIRVCLITTQTGLVPDSSAPTIVIPPDTLIVHTSNTWSGESCPSHLTRNQSSLSCYTWNFSSDEVARLVDLIHGRSMTGEKWELKQPIRTYCPEADTPIWEFIEGTHPSTRLTSAFWGGGIDEETMQALPIPSFTRKKCYRELIARIIKEGHTRWKLRNTQLSESGDLNPHLWSPKPRTLTSLPSPHKRKRDVAWSIQRITETNMQKLLHNYTFTAHLPAVDTTEENPLSQDEGSGGSGNSGEWGEWEGDSGDAGGGKPRPLSKSTTSCIRTGSGPGGDRGAEGIVTGRARGMVGLLAPVAESSARPPRKRKLDTDNIQEGDQCRPLRQRKDKATAHVAQHIYSAHNKHTGTIQPTLYTDCTTGQASLHGGGDGNYTDYLFKKLN